MSNRLLLFMLIPCFFLSPARSQVTAVSDDTAPIVRRVPAEFEKHEATWMQWPRLFEASYRNDFAGIIKALQPYEPINIIVLNNSERDKARTFLHDHGVTDQNISFHIMPYNWAWMRDNGPVWVEENNTLTIQDWKFDAWGGIVRPWGKDDAVPAVLADDLDIPYRDLAVQIVERGSLEFNGVDTVILSWPVQHDRNPGWSKAHMERLFKRVWGVKKIVWLLSAPKEDAFTGGHVDGIARFINTTTVAVVRQQPGEKDAQVYEQAAKIIKRAGFKVVRLDIPGEIKYKGIMMSAEYINWLVANGVVIVPGFNMPEWDEQAANKIRKFFPDRDVRVVDIREIWYWGGGVHCVTNDQPAIGN